MGGEGGDEGAAFWDYQHRDKRGETQETNGAAKNFYPNPTTTSLRDPTGKIPSLSSHFLSFRFSLKFDCVISTF